MEAWAALVVLLLMCFGCWWTLFRAQQLRRVHRLTNNPEARRQLFAQVWRAQVDGSKEFYNVDRDGL